ncbi:hypothetical protein P7K49_014003, partial [Saguinus oedipus]
MSDLQSMLHTSSLTSGHSVHSSINQKGDDTKGPHSFTFYHIAEYGLHKANEEELCWNHQKELLYSLCSENGLAQKQRTPRRRYQQPKMLSSPEDTMYYNQLN